MEFKVNSCFPSSFQGIFGQIEALLARFSSAVHVCGILASFEVHTWGGCYYKGGSLAQTARQGGDLLFLAQLSVPS